MSEIPLISGPMGAVEECPGCGGNRVDAVGLRGNAFTTSVQDKDYTQPAYDILECPNCGLLYKSHVLSDQALGDYYSEVDFRKWEIKGLFPTERLVKGELAKLPQGSRILDVGCSSGRLLSSLEDGFHRFGIEPNIVAAAEASSKGIAILPSVDDSNVESFDAILLMDVFEHLTEPTKTLAHLVTRLKPGGLLLIATGDGDNGLCRKSPAEFWYFRNVEHVCMITKAFVDHLTRQIPLEIERWHITSHYDSSTCQRFVKWLRPFAYRQSRLETLWWRCVIRFLPMLGRASRWSNCPSYDLGKDHVVAVFSKRY